MIRKKRLRDLNVFNPREAFDWRISVSLEEPGTLLGNMPDYLFFVTEE